MKLNEVSDVERLVVCVSVAVGSFLFHSDTRREYHHFKDTQSPQPHSFW